MVEPLDRYVYIRWSAPLQPAPTREIKWDIDFPKQVRDNKEFSSQNAQIATPQLKERMYSVLLSMQMPITREAEV